MALHLVDNGRMEAKRDVSDSLLALFCESHNDVEILGRLSFVLDDSEAVVPFFVFNMLSAFVKDVLFDFMVFDCGGIVFDGWPLALGLEVSHHEGFPLLPVRTS